MSPVPVDLRQQVQRSCSQTRRGGDPESPPAPASPPRRFARKPRVLASISRLGVLLLAAFLPRLASAQVSCLQEVCLDVVETASAVSFVAENDRYIDVVVSLRLTRSSNLAPLGPLPLALHVPPRTRLPVVSLQAVDPYQEWSYVYEWNVGIGNPHARHDDTTRYRLPFDGDQPRLLLQGVGGTFSHTGTYYNAFDFRMPLGTLVLAARPGIVARIIDGFFEGGPDSALIDKANLVTVSHDDGTYGDYVHLGPHSVLVHEGERVHAGQPLGRSGNTGFTSEPHLHFMVWQATADGRSAESVPIRFNDGSPEGYVPREGLWYGNAASEAAPAGEPLESVRGLP